MFSATYQLLEQESLIVRSCLCTGLTGIRNANLHDKGRYYTAFFQLAIGIERMAKLALILDCMAQNNLCAPGQQAVRTYGHDLKTLFATVQATAQARGYTLRSIFTLSQLSTDVLEFLSEFATGMRYANLDALASGNAQREPLHEWNQILQGVVKSKVPAKTKRRVTQQSTAVANALQDMSLVMASDLDGKPLSIATALSNPALLDAAAKQLIWELLSLLAPLRDFIVESGHSAERTTAAQTQSIAHIPNMSEFFDFIWLDRGNALRKKRWP